MTEQRSPRVFISYRHEPERSDHADRVLALADRLRAGGIDAVHDQYETAPPEGWPTWCEREIVRADYVLMVCTKAYRRTLDGEEPAGGGHGVLWEARLIRQLVYDAGTKTAKVVPLLFTDGVTEHVPLVVRGATQHNVDTEDGFENLYRQLTDQPKARKPELGTLLRLPERPRQWRERPPDMSDGVVIEAASCPNCKSTSIYDFSSVEIESAFRHKGTWQLTGKVVNCARCGQALKSMSKLIELHICDALLCQYCKTGGQLRCRLDKIEKIAPDKWSFDVRLYCAKIGCRFSKLLEAAANMMNLKRVEIGLSSVALEKEDDKMQAPLSPNS